MLGYVMSPQRGDADLLLAAVADRLERLGWSLAGAVQVNRAEDKGRPCTMELVVLQGRQRLCISQFLGTGSKGCRLDQAALEQAVGLVAATLDADRVDTSRAAGTAPPRLLIVNKFGKAEGEGHGFRPLIGRALLQGTPVLTGVNTRNIDAFLSFADGMAQALPADVASVLDWCHSVATAQGGHALQTGLRA